MSWIFETNLSNLEINFSYQTLFLDDYKSLQKNSIISKTKRAFNINKKLISSSLKQIKPYFGRWESDFKVKTSKKAGQFDATRNKLIWTIFISEEVFHITRFDWTKRVKFTNL